MLCGALLLGGSAAAEGPAYQLRGLLLSNDAMSTADMFSLSQPSFNFGTARSMAMGGAFTSLGADQASMTLNPAGLGMYRRGDVAITPVMTFARASTPDGLSPTSAMPYRSNSKNRFALGNIGAVFNVYEGQGKLLSLNLGVGYNRIADYNYSYSFEFAGNNLTSSLADVLCMQLEAGGAYVNKNGEIAMSLGEGRGEATNYRIDPFFWPGVAGYKTYLADQNANGVWYPSEIGDNATIDGGASVRSIGSAGEFDISMGGNLNNKLYFGFTLGIQSIYQKKSIYYGEKYSYNGGNGYNTGDTAVDQDGKQLDNVMQRMGMNQVVRVEGAGVNFKVGVTYRPIEGLRLGMAFHTPTYYSLDRTYMMSMSTASIGPTDAEKEDFRPHDYTSDTVSDRLEDTGDSGWSFVSPSRLLFGASYTFGSVAIVSVDYERDWYNGIRVKNQPYLPYGQVTSDFKKDFKYYFKGSNTLRVGVEVRPLPILAVRAGFGYTGSMLRDEQVYLSSPVVYQTTYYTAGLGFMISRSVYLDLAYCYIKDKQTPYHLFYGSKFSNASDTEPTEHYQSEAYRTDLTRHNVALTLGFRF